MEEREKKEILKEILERRETVFQREKKKEGKIQRGRRPRMEVKEKRVFGKQRHTKGSQERLGRQERK